MERPAALLFPLVVFGGLLLMMLLALLWQRKGLVGQKQALSHIDENLVLARRSIELQERSIALADEAIHNQREMIQLLHRIANRRWIEQGESPV